MKVLIKKYIIKSYFIGKVQEYFSVRLKTCIFWHKLTETGALSFWSIYALLFFVRTGVRTDVGGR